MPEQIKQGWWGGAHVRSPLCLATLPSAVPNAVLPVLHSQQQLDENSPLGDLLGGVLDVPSCQIGECQGGREDWGVFQPCRVMFAGLLGQRASASVCLEAPLCLLQVNTSLWCVLAVW